MGPKVFGAFWTHDGSAQDPKALGRGNRWIILGIVVTVPFCSHPVCLPVLFRLWRGKGTASPVQLARELISILAQAFPDRLVHAVGDAAYHGKALLVPATTITTRLPANAALYALAPPRTGKRGRPRSKGARLGRPVGLAATAQWRRATITRYGRSVIAEIADIPSIWYGAFGNTPGRTVLVRDPGDILVQRRRDAKAAKRFFRKLLKRQCTPPRVLVTDKLRSYRVAHQAVMPSVEHRQSRYEMVSLVGQSHLPHQSHT